MKINTSERIISAALVICTLISMIPVSVHASDAAVVDHGTCGDNLTWTLDNDGTLTISGLGDMYDYSPSNSPWSKLGHVIVQEGVTSIGNNAFLNTGISSISLPETLTAIGDYAFAGSSSLTSFHIPQNVSTIGEGVFGGCASLSDITVSEENPSFYTDDFGVLFCRLTSSLLRAPATLSGQYSIPDGTKRISRTAFQFLYLVTSIEIPGSVDTIDDASFNDCYSLKRINVSPSNNHYFSDVSGVLYTIDGNVLIACPGAYCGNYDVLPSVRRIATAAFDGCDLSSVTTSTALREIGEGAFSGTGLKEVFYCGAREQWEQIIIRDYALLKRKCA